MADMRVVNAARNRLTVAISMKARWGYLLSARIVEISWIRARNVEEPLMESSERKSAELGAKRIVDERIEPLALGTRS